MKNSYKLIILSVVVTSFHLSTASPTPGPDYEYDISPRAEEAASAPADTSATNTEEAGQRGPGGGFHGGGGFGHGGFRGGFGRGGFGRGRFGYGYGWPYYGGYGGYPYGYYGGYGYAPCVVGDIRPECIGVGVGVVGVTPGVGVVGTAPGVGVVGATPGVSVVGTTPAIGVVLKRSVDGSESGQEESNTENAYDYENFDLEDHQPLEFVD